MAETINSYKINEERGAAGVGLVAHILFFILVNSALCYICMTETSSVKYWIVWPLVGWGIGLYLHARSTYYFSFYKEV